MHKSADYAQQHNPGGEAHKEKLDQKKRTLQEKRNREVYEARTVGEMSTLYNSFLWLRQIKLGRVNECAYI